MYIYTNIYNIYIYASPPPQGLPFKIQSCFFLYFILNKKYLLHKLIYIVAITLLFFPPLKYQNNIKFIIVNIFTTSLSTNISHIINVIYIVDIIFIYY